MADDPLVPEEEVTTGQSDQSDFTGDPFGGDDRGQASGLTEEAFSYPETTIDVKYVLYPGVRVQRPASQTGAGETVVLHAPFWNKIVQFSYEKIGSWPTVPHWDTGNPNEVLVRAEVTPAKPAEGGNLRVFRVSGLYVYELLQPPGADAGPFPTAVSPESTATQVENTMQSSFFDRNALGRVDGYQQ